MATSDNDNSSVVSTDDEKFLDDETTWEETKTVTLPFGKYKGKTMESMLKSGRRRHYLRYLQKWDELLPRTRSHIDCALAEYDSLKRKAAAEKSNVAAPKAKKARKTK